MPDEFDFKNYESMEDYGKTVEGTKYLHSLYLKAVNHPVRREILIIVNEAKKISKNRLLDLVKSKEIVNDEASLDYNLDYLIKALCVKKTVEENETFYEITQSGQVVDYL
ncbi:MAG: hypothetical protein ACW98D_13980 [Promethearchaeota archaeon]|jgi:hypothetical protein